MALTRSNSGPGGLSINTGTANLFGSTTSQPPAASGLFGGSQASQPKPLFGAVNTSTQAQTAQATPSLFGAKAATQPASAGLFSSTTTSQPTQTSSLFGAPLATQPSGNMFGNTQSQQGSSLFGNAAAKPATSQGTGGLFGSTQQPAQTGSLFGGLTNQTQSNPTRSLFGNPAQSQQSQPQVSSLFNKPAQANTGFGSTLGSGLTMGQSGNQQSQNTVPGVRIDISQLRPTTRFNDLHEDLQKQIENFDKFILVQEQQAHDCNAIMPSHAEQLLFVPDNVDFLSRKLIGVETSLEGDAQDVALVRKLVHVDTENAKLSFRATDNLKLPQQFHQGIWNAPKPPPSSSSGDSTTTDSARDLVSFFSQTADEMKSTLAKYEGRIGEIELHLRTVEANIMQAQIARGVTPTDSIQELAAVFRDFEMGILGVAGEVGGVRESFQRLALGGFVDENIRHGSEKRRGVY